jgi:NADH dehydrogenase
MIYVSSASVVYPYTTAYARSKKRSETIVRHAGMQWTIVRPTLVYDEYKGGEFGMFLSFLRRFPVVPFIGPGTARKRPVYAPDLADGLARLCRHDDAAGRVFNFSGPEVVSIEDFARLCLILSGMPRTRIVHLPVWLCLCMAALAHMLMKEPPLTWQVIAGMTQDADIDPGETQRILGYNPRGVHEMLPHCFSRQNVFYSNIATDSHIATQ